MNETQQPKDYEDPNWSIQEQMRDEALRQRDVEEAFRRLYTYLGSRVEQDWELLAQALDERFPGFLDFYRSL